MHDSWIKTILAIGGFTKILPAPVPPPAVTQDCACVILCKGNPKFVDTSQEYPIVSHLEV